MIIKIEDVENGWIITQESQTGNDDTVNVYTEIEDAVEAIKTLMEDN